MLTGKLTADHKLHYSALRLPAVQGLITVKLICKPPSITATSY